MKITQLLGLIVSLLTIQSVSALTIRVLNMEDKSISVDPIYYGRARSWDMLQKQEAGLYYKDYNSQLSQLKGILVRHSDGKCYYYHFVPNNMWGGGNISISIYSDKTAIVDGYLDVLGKSKMTESFSGKLFDCARTANFQ